ncbi:MAG: hypothetical protein PHO33_04370, partial [Clostridia bacterium]|nr:hypothetical protein [Clostridia bacterium]
MIENLQDFIVPDWIKKGALTKGMFEPVDYKFWNEHKEQIVLDAGSILRTLTDSIYPEAIKKYEAVLSHAKQASATAIMDATTKINELENELYTIKNILIKYIQILPARFDYSSRYREDNSATKRIHLDGTPTKTLQNDIIIRSPHKKEAEFHTLFWYALGIQLAVNKELPISQMNDYDGFLTLADQIYAAHALTYYAGLIEIRHNKEIENIYNKDINELQRKLLIKAEDELYNKTVTKIKYNWEIWRPTLVQSIANKTPLKLKIIESPIESEIEQETSPKSAEEFYKTALDNVLKISIQIRIKAKDQGIEL